MSDVAYALERLNDLVDGGWDLEAAATRIALEEDVDQTWLLEVYDNQFK